MTRAKFGLSFFAAALLCGTAQAQISNDKVKIGVLTDLSGGYEQNSGNGSVEAAKIAAEEFGNKIKGKPIEVVAGDHQNKPDVGASVANRWFDLEQVDMITDLVNSAVGFAVLDIAKAKNKMIVLTSAGSDEFTGKACAPNNSVHWIYDTYQMGQSVGTAMPRLGKTWFILYADYAFGKILTMERARKRRLCLAIGLSAIALFIVLRGFNLYGDPRPWHAATVGRNGSPRCRRCLHS